MFSKKPLHVVLDEIREGNLINEAAAATEEDPAAEEAKNLSRCMKLSLPL